MIMVTLSAGGTAGPGAEAAKGKGRLPRSVEDAGPGPAGRIGGMALKEPLVSVIIPAYHVEKRLGKCVESVCAQTWENLEILIIDDGSTDGTGRVADEWAAKDARVRVEHQANAGVSAARNRALDMAAGEWVRFVDADDWLPPDSIEKLLRRVERERSDLVMAGYEHQVGELCHVFNLAKRDDTVSCEAYLAFLNPNANSFFCGALWNKLFRRELIERAGARFESGLGYGEDFLFVCAYLTEAKRISFSTDVVYRYVRHPHSMTFAQTWDSVQHPIRNLKTKYRLYQGLKALYRRKNVYDQYRGSLWQYMIRATINQ